MKYLPVIRHVRYLYYRTKFNLWWSSARNIWLIPNQADLDYLEAVWKGLA